MLVHGILGGVGTLAAQLARWGGATVIGTRQRAGSRQRAVFQASRVYGGEEIFHPELLDTVRTFSSGQWVVIRRPLRRPARLIAAVVT
ncbi:hypothetical protein [Nonomuraea sp. NPDC049141]|uniref:hypothetical protein n=1 Tax=unclassified Nonomuraea TaxID=2593643 RepID=UPI0033F224FD